VTAVAVRVGIDFDLDVPVSHLTVHQQWLVTIARALADDSELIVMDEPTASLDAEESKRLLKVARDLAAEGVAVVFISHRLDEIIDICDQVTVFKDGEITLSADRAEMSRELLVEAIVGRAIVTGENRHRTRVDKMGTVVLAAQDVHAGKALHGASIAVRRGELLGVAGLVGSGRSELARIIFGADRPDSGTMELDNEAYSPHCVNDATTRGVAYVPEERRAQALFLELSVESNLHVSTWASKLVRGTPFVSSRLSHGAAMGISEQLGIVLRSAGVRQPVSGLSGGNQQKVVIGRWMQSKPQLLILDEPTRGVDVGARSDIYERIRGIAEGGTAVIVISSDFEELLECDRVTVMSAGHTVGELSGSDITVDEMLRLCFSA
jgi:ABC-type sugar transport system ATPase subunit